MWYYQSALSARRSLVCDFPNSAVIHHGDTDDLQIISTDSLSLLQAMGDDHFSDADLKALIEQRGNIEKTADTNIETEKLIDTLVKQRLLVKNEAAS